MSDAKSFNCPNCGSALMPEGQAKLVKCAFCNSTVIVPEELRAQEQHSLRDDKSPYFGPHHLQWLIQHGADATAKVDSVKDKGEAIVVYWKGRKATGEAFNSHAELKIPRPARPRRGDTIQIKYNPDGQEELDFVLQIGGQYYWDIVLWANWRLE